MERTEIPTDQSLDAWKDWWVEATCSCRRRYYPCTLLGPRYGADKPVAEAARKLLCQECGERPSTSLVSEPIPVGFPTARQPTGVMRVRMPPT